MPNIDVLITNPGHHPAMFLPVMRVLRQKGHRCRVLSLCELRGFVSPSTLFQRDGFEIERVIPLKWRPSPSLGTGGSSPTDGFLRTVVRQILWLIALRPGLTRAVRAKPDALLLPNDGAFPFDRICDFFRKAGVPVVVVQEGIRFHRPAGTKDGTCRAEAYAVWGPSSTAYFLNQGLPAAQIEETGSPRFDVIDATDWSSAALEVRRRLSLTSNPLLFLSNPIDDLGFVTTRRKLELFRRFASGICPLMRDSNLELVVKIHGRESIRSFEKAAHGLPCSGQIKIVRDSELYPLIAASRAAVMFGSTAGLEVLLFNKPLAVLEIPGIGFIHDFVASGAARGLEWSSPMSEQVEDWLSTCDQEESPARRFVDTTTTHVGRSAEAVARVIEKTIATVSSADPTHKERP